MDRYMHIQGFARRSLLALMALALALLLAPRSVWAQEATAVDDPFAEAPALGLEDGTYSIAVKLDGGTGRASVTSPTELTVVGGAAVARITWSSPNYDYMLVAGKRYLPVNKEGDSVFEIPVLALDEPFDVVGDTTAMSEPHEVDYQLTFDTSSMQATAEGSAGQPFAPILPVAVALVVLAGVVVAMQMRRAHT